MSFDTRHIHLWSSPRNVSTALMYAFAQRTDTRVVDEPLYAAYLHRYPQLDHPGRIEIISSQPTDLEQAIAQWYRREDKPLMVYKQMTHHLRGINWSFLLKDGLKHVLLIRDPAHIIASYAKVISRPTMEDIGMKMQSDLYDFFRERDRLAAVVDAMELLKNPEAVLEALCQRLNIDFQPDMLQWPAGPRPEDGVWARHWYARVHTSTGFLPYRPEAILLSPENQDLADRCAPYYERLYEASITAP